MGRTVYKRASKSARRRPKLTLIAALLLLATAAWASVGAFAKSDPPGPTLTSFTLVGSSPTNAASVSWRVVFSASVTGVAASNFQLVQGGGLSGGRLDRRDG